MIGFSCEISNDKYIFGLPYLGSVLMSCFTSRFASKYCLSP